MGNRSSISHRYIKKILASGMTALIISNKEIDDLMKTVKSFEESGLLKKGISKTIENDAKEQKKWIPWYVIRHSKCQFIYLVGKGVI